MSQFTLKVQKIFKETEDSVTLSLKQPILKKVKYRAGQYLTIILRINGKRFLRPYSFSSAPGSDPFLEITVKRVVGGIVSNYIVNEVKEGDTIEVLSPTGRFTLSESGPKSVIFLWGVGSGITPLFSILKEVLFQHKSTNVILVYGNKSKDTAIFWDKISNLEQGFSDRLKVWHFLTQSNKSSDVVQGRIDPIMVLSNQPKDLVLNSDHYICGPQAFKNVLIELLIGHGVICDSIYSEDFVNITNHEELKTLEDRVISLDFRGREIELLIKGGKSILDAALDAGLDLDYSCRIGTCIMCKCHLESGELKRLDKLENRVDLESNEYLMCSSYPITNDVIIRIP